MNYRKRTYDESKVLDSKIILPEQWHQYPTPLGLEPGMTVVEVVIGGRNVELEGGEFKSGGLS